MLLKKGELHLLVRYVDAKAIAPEVTEKLTMLFNLLKAANPTEEIEYTTPIE